MLRNEASDLPDQALEALGNPERRRLLRLLAENGAQSVGQLADGFAISRPAISRHLKLLESAGLVRHEAAGTRNLYSLDGSGLAATAAWLNGFWDDAERRLRLVAENLPEDDRG
jgi:DNA-binding transcriptional ArsR family regulator